MTTINEGIFKRRWDGVFPADIQEYVSKNGFELVKDPKNKEILVGFRRGDKEALFRYDTEEYVMYSDHTPLDFSFGRLKKK